ncbi:hypothetical protein CJ030_MR8G011204 [Morella rubra]|uniref:Uncharacterized protein n=1 Tax=Morella rubra TaxID=262757 RepID=A0A6A1UTC1_9ROSI|nr:hypothetical protein CJ030_MR8G011204 [Morella rubra]
MKRTRVDMQPPTQTLRLVVRVLCMMMAIMMPMVAMSSFPLSPSSPAPSAESVLFRPLQEQVQRGEEQYQAQPGILQEDYGIWNPTPYDGGGGAAPIPH